MKLVEFVFGGGRRKAEGKEELTMVTEEDSKRERKPQSQPQPRVFKGAEEFESNRLHSVVALGIWLGAIHFNLALLFFSFFLPLSKAFLFVFFSGPSQCLFIYFFYVSLLLLFSNSLYFEFNQGIRNACNIYVHSG